MRKLLLVIVFGVIFLLPQASIQAQVLGFEISNNAKRVHIPFEIYNNLIVIPVILNNQLPLKFVLDTGVRTTILTEKAFSDILNLVYTKKYTISGLGGEKLVDAYITNNVSLTLPGVRGRGHAMLVLEKDYLELRNFLGADVHGILGYELFSRFIVEINYDKRILTLTTPDYFKPKKKYKSIPMTIEDTKPYIHGQIEYKSGEKVRTKLLVDTGASHGLLLEKDSDPEIFVPEKHINTPLGRGLGGTLTGEIARLKSFNMGGMCWEDIIATFPDSNSLLDSIKSAGTFRNGSVGGEILSRFNVIIDFPQEKLYLKRGKHYKKRFTYNLSGLVVKAKGSRLNTYEISDVRKNSVGEEAGFEQGDIIMSINNIDVSKLHLNNIINYLNSRENKKIKITVKRGDERITHKFRLRAEI